MKTLRINPDTIRRQLIEGEEAPAKVRIECLKNLNKVPLAWLARLLQKPELPAQVKLAALRLYEAEVTRRKGIKASKPIVRNEPDLLGGDL